MRLATLQEMGEVFSSPFYVFLKSGGGNHTVDKITIDGKKTTRERYIITAGQQCTCLSFLKVQKCKHLEMLNPDSPEDSWVKHGCNGTYAIEEVARIIKLLSKYYKPDQICAHDQQEDPGVNIRVVNIITKVPIKGLEMVVGVKKFEAEHDLGIRLIVVPPESNSSDSAK
jgi:hypothetical protein